MGVKEDIIEILREKEKEMEGLVVRAKERGGKLRKDALKRAGEIKELKAREVQQEILSLKESEGKSIEKEVMRIEKEAEGALAELRAKAVDRKTEAVDFVTGFVLNGVLKVKGDEKAPGRRERSKS
jgi:vacuolar-type H+-ATPase subunit H